MKLQHPSTTTNPKTVPRIVGMLRDTHNCEVYHRRKIDFFFIEIPNTPGFEIERSNVEAELTSNIILSS